MLIFLTGQVEVEVFLEGTTEHETTVDALLVATPIVVVLALSTVCILESRRIALVIRMRITVLVRISFLRGA